MKTSKMENKENKAKKREVGFLRTVGQLQMYDIDKMILLEEERDNNEEKQ